MPQFMVPKIRPPGPGNAVWDACSARKRPVLSIADKADCGVNWDLYGVNVWAGRANEVCMSTCVAPFRCRSMLQREGWFRNIRSRVVHCKHHKAIHK